MSEIDNKIQNQRARIYKLGVVSFIIALLEAFWWLIVFKIAVFWPSMESSLITHYPSGPIICLVGLLFALFIPVGIVLGIIAVYVIKKSKGRFTGTMIATSGFVIEFILLPFIWRSVGMILFWLFIRI